MYRMLPSLLYKSIEDHFEHISNRKTHIDKELRAERDKMGIVHGGRDRHAPSAPAVHEAQAERTNNKRSHKGDSCNR